MPAPAQPRHRAVLNDALQRWPRTPHRLTDSAGFHASVAALASTETDVNRADIRLLIGAQYCVREIAIL